MSAPEMIIVGRLRRVHGIRGEMVVEAITDEPAEVFAAGRRLFVGTTAGDPAPDSLVLTVRRVRAQAEGPLIVSFDELADRSAAEPLRNRYLLVEADELSPPAEGEAYVHELIGMLVTIPGGDALGEVVDVFDLPQGLAVDVKYGKGTVLLPLIGEFVQSVDRVARRIVATPPEGLFE
jgi:16S rRNA processing protein RimM